MGNNAMKVDVNKMAGVSVASSTWNDLQATLWSIVYLLWLPVDNRVAGPDIPKQEDSLICR